MALVLVALNLWHGNPKPSSMLSEVPLWQGFLVFGVTNLCAKVAMDLVGVAGAL